MIQPFSVDQKETVLVRIITRSSASRDDRYESARIILLEGGANEDNRSEDKQQDPLRIAARLSSLQAM